MRKLIRLAILVALAVWAWRKFFGPSGSEERAGVSYADGSAVVLEPGSPGLRATRVRSRAPRFARDARRARRARSSSARCWRATSSSARAAARPGTSTSTASRPSREILRALGEALAAAVARVRARRRAARRTGSRRRSRWQLRQRWRPDCRSSSCAVKPRNTARHKRIEGPFESGRAGVPPRGRRHLRRRARGGSVGRPRRRGSWSETPSVWSIGRRAARTLSPASVCASGRSSGRASCWSCAKSPESSMVEPNPKGC